MSTSNPLQEKRKSIDYIKSIFNYEDKDIKNVYDEFTLARNKNENNNAFLDTFIRFGNKDVRHASDDMIAIDVGGSFLKIGIYSKDYKLCYEIGKYEVLRTPLNKEKDLFEWIVENVKKYLLTNEFNLSVNLKAAVTFSYPVKMTSIKTGYIIEFSKDYPFKPIDLDAKTDPIEKLNEQFNKNNLKITAEVLLNDTTATYLATYCVNKKVDMGVVLGTGTNGAFLDEQGRLINTEWGCFDNIKMKKNEYDHIIREKIAPREFANIDCMLGGLKFKEILKMITLVDDVDKMIDSYYKRNLYRNIIKYEIKVMEVIKKRTFAILSALILSLIPNTTKNIVIGINGSGIENEKDKKMLTKAIKKNYKLFNSEKNAKISVDLVFVENASLLGAVYALSYEGLLPIL